MARVKGAMMTRKRRKKTLKLAKSYWGSKSTHFKMAKQAVKKSGVYAYVGRRLKKRDFRQLWITRISAAVAPLPTPLRLPLWWMWPRRRFKVCLQAPAAALPGLFASAGRRRN